MEERTARISATNKSAVPSRLGRGDTSSSSGGEPNGAAARVLPEMSHGHGGGGSLGLLQDLVTGGAGSPGVLATSTGPSKPRAIGPKAWLKMNEEGICTPVTIDKHRLSSLLRVPMRDLRMLEPNFSNSYSAAILTRERCIVVHLEHVRLLITAEEVYLQDGRNPTVTKYLPELQRRLLMRKLKLMDSHGVPNIYPAAPKIPEEELTTDSDAEVGEDQVTLQMSTPARGATSMDGDVSVRAGKTRAMPPTDAASQAAEGAGVPKGMGNRSQSFEDLRFQQKLSPLGLTASKAEDATRLLSPKSTDGKRKEKDGVSGGGKSVEFDAEESFRNRLNQRRNEVVRQEDLPFELIALEVALEIVCNQLEAEQRDVGVEAKPVLEGLRKKVNTANLERVRRLKSRVTRIKTRVSKVREEIHRYLDDDSDMRDMYLTRRLLAEMFVPTPGAGLERGGSGSYFSPRYPLSQDPRRRQSGSFNDMQLRQRSFERAQLDAALSGGAEDGQGGADGAMYDEDEYLGYDDPKDDDKDLQEVEDLLETYFTHIDSTFNELETLDEFIDDTEDFVNIELDSQRNQLIKFELILTTATLFVSIYGVIAGVFGMNLKNGHEESKRTFMLVNALSTVGTIVAFVVAVFVIRYKRIL